MNSASPPAPQQLMRPIRPIHFRTTTNKRCLCERLPKNAYNLDLQATRKLIRDLANEIQVLQTKMMQMIELHKTTELERQMQIYAMGSIIKDYEKYTDATTYASKCYATYYLHKYLLKKRILHDSVPLLKKKKTNDPQAKENTPKMYRVVEYQQRDVQHIHTLSFV